MNEDQYKLLVERLAALEHEQWIYWTKQMSEHWSNHWVPFSDLSENMKELDRKWARRVIRLLNEVKDH